jgi:hypothetical protein
MKAIIKVNNQSAYSKYNFLTFEVKEVLRDIISIKIEENLSADFSIKEVIIIDFNKEYQKAYDANNWGANWKNSACFNFLCEYALFNNICAKKLEYNCPA